MKSVRYYLSYCKAHPAWPLLRRMSRGGSRNPSFFTLAARSPAGRVLLTRPHRFPVAYRPLFSKMPLVTSR